MASLLEELFHDLGRRATEIAEELRKCASSVPSEVEAYRAQMESRASRASALTATILGDPDLNAPLFAQNFYRDFRDIARLVQALEHLPLLVLRRFDPRDLVMTRLLARICSETGYPFTPPICSSLSSQYFWTMPDMDLIFVPSLEPDRLLGLPDIYHELGHVLLFREERRFKIPILAEIERHFDRLRRDAVHANWPPESLDELEGYRYQWRASWWLEFGADLVATYLAGPSFGWCNIRTSTCLGGELHVGNESHPADDARATAIAMMLDKINATQESADIRQRWSELVQLSGETRPHRFELAYPEELLSALCDCVFDCCNQLGLRQWAVADATEKTIGAELDRAWTEFRQRPESFVGYEQQVLKRLV
jgi:hypothetical protein